MDTAIHVLPAYSKLRRLPTVSVLLLIASLLPTIVRSALNNRQENCPASVGNYTSTDSFGTNLNLLFASLSANSAATGFFNSSKGDGASQAYGLALCRGDLVLPFDCKPCVENAVRDLLQVCAGKREATIWYDDCLVRYSDKNFFGVPTGSLPPTLVSGQTAPHAIRFQEALRALVESVARRAAASAPSPSSVGLYAVEEARWQKNSKLYSMAQCTRDLSGDDCYTCLKDVMRYISFDSAWTGLRTLGGSCFIRYESAPFYTIPRKPAGR